MDFHSVYLDFYDSVQFQAEANEKAYTLSCNELTSHLKLWAIHAWEIMSFDAKEKTVVHEL